MSKITFRADDDLVEAVEELDASKSEVMREALRAYLEGGRPKRATESLTAGPRAAEPEPEEAVDGTIAARVDAILADRLPPGGRAGAQDVNLHITVDAEGAATAERTDGTRDQADAAGMPGLAGSTTCAQCGDMLNDEHVYCPNCGEKATQRVFCECGDEVRADWSFCPHCGRRTTSADVLDR